MGQAKLKGDFEQRKKEAIKQGRAKLEKGELEHKTLPKFKFDKDAGHYVADTDTKTISLDTRDILQNLVDASQDKGQQARRINVPVELNDDTYEGTIQFMPKDWTILIDSFRKGAKKISVDVLTTSKAYTTPFKEKIKVIYANNVKSIQTYPRAGQQIVSTYMPEGKVNLELSSYADKLQEVNNV